METPFWIIVVVGAFGAWSLLRLLGAEREQRMRELYAKVEQELATHPQKQLADLPTKRH